MATKTETFVDTLKINKLTKKLYDEAKAAGQIKETELYMLGEVIGDMDKTTYDTNNDGIVNKADLATNATTASKVASSLIIKLNSGTAENTNQFTFNGSAAKTVNITPSNIGAAAASHTHDNSQIIGMTANRALISDGNGKLAESAVTSTELGYLDGVTSNVQTQLNDRYKVHMLYNGSSNLTTYVRVCSSAASIGSGKAGFSAIILGGYNYAGTKIPMCKVSFSPRGYTGTGAITDVVEAVAIGGGTLNSEIISFIAKLNGTRLELWAKIPPYSYETKMIVFNAQEIQIHCDSVTNTAPTGTIRAFDTARAYTTAAKPTPADIGAAAASHTHSYLPLAGGTLTGFLTLNANPTANLHAATKQYVDSKISAAGGGDMLKSVYDTNGDGVVNKADLATTATNATTASKVANSLILKLNSGTTEGTNQFTFNGSTAKTANITAASVGAAAASHTHDHAQVIGMTANRALISDGSGKLAESAVTSTELGYLDGVTSAIQTQLNGKAASNHTHGLGTGSFTSSITETTSSINGWGDLGGESDEDFILKSAISAQTCPEWTNPENAVIAFGGRHTRGNISKAAISLSGNNGNPSIVFAGGDGAGPAWKFKMYGTDDGAYDLSYFDGLNKNVQNEFNVINSTINAIPRIPTGTVQAFAGKTAPSGWLICNGQAVSRTTYASLFAVIGTTYGSGNGTSTFNVPNLIGNVIIGGNSTDVGKKTGEQTHKLTAPEMPSHNHYIGAESGGSGYWLYGGNRDNLAQPGQYATGQWAFRAQEIAADGANGAHNNMQPSVYMTYIIKT